MVDAPTPSPRQRWLTFLLFLLPLAFYLGLSFYQVQLPGPNYDEAVEAKAAVQLLRGLPVDIHRDAAVNLFGQRWPLMIVDYVGALNTYALLVVFKVFGIAVGPLRGWSIAIGALILWLTYRLAQAVNGHRGAFMAAMLLAVHPSFVFFSRQGIYVTNTTIAFALAILLSLWRWVHTGNMRWWYLVVFLSGLGLWAKFIMLWPLVATAILAPAVWVLRKPFGLQPAPGFSPRQALAPKALLTTGSLFLIGLGPFLIFNWQTGATFDHFLGTLNQSYYGVQNTDYLANLGRRWDQIGSYLRGDHFWYLGGSFIDTLAQPLWILGFAMIVGILIWRWRDGRQRALAFRALFFYAFFLLLLFQTPLTPTDLWYTHLAFFSPVLALGAALGWDLGFQQIGKRMGWAAAVIFVLIATSSSLRADLGYHRALTATGGYGDHADASYRLSETLLAEGFNRPYALDWGFQAPIILISQGRVTPIEVFGYEPYDRPDAGFRDRMSPLLNSQDAIFLVHAPDRTNFPGRREALEALAADMGVELVPVAVIRERSGAPHTEIWRPRPFEQGGS